MSEQGKWKVLDSDCDENSYDIDTGKERLRMVTDDYQMACDICHCHNDALRALQKSLGETLNK